MTVKRDKNAKDCCGLLKYKLTLQYVNRSIQKRSRASNEIQIFFQFSTGLE